MKPGSWILPACLLAVASLSAVLTVVPDILVPDASLAWVDAWYYVGFALRLPTDVREYATSLYQAERVSWTLPGYLANLVAPPLVANYLTKSVFYLATLSFLFGALRLSCSRRTAAFVTCAAAFYSFALHAIGANLVDGPSTTYFVIAIYFANRSTTSKRSPVLAAFLSGAAYVAAIVSHFILVVILPFFAAYAVFFRAQARQRSDRSILTLAGAFLAGGTAGYLCLVGLYRYWGIHTWPLALSFNLFAARTPNPLIWPNSMEWLPSAMWLWLPTVVILSIALTGVTTVSRAGLRSVADIPAAQWFFTAVFAVWVGATIGKAPFLMLPFYVSYLIPIAFLALGSLLDPTVTSVSPRMFWSLLALMFLTPLLAYRISNANYATRAEVVVGVCSLAAFATGWLPPAAMRWRAPGMLTLVIIAFAAIDYASADFDVQLWNAYRRTAMTNIYHEPRSAAHWKATRREQYSGVVATAARLSPRLAGKHYQFWYDGDDPMGMYFRSIGSTFFAWSTDRILNEHFPELTATSVERLTPRPGQPPRDIVVLTRNPHISLPSLPVAVTQQWSEGFVAAHTPYYAHYLAIAH